MMRDLPISIFVAGWAIQFFVALYFYWPVFTNFAPNIRWRDLFAVQQLGRISFFELAPAFFNEDGQKHLERWIRVRPRLRICLLTWVFVAGPVLGMIQTIIWQP
jgi:hypothetical protein